MTDRELLERAARAAGLTIMWSEPFKRYERFVLEKYAGPWNPLVDDGDAFRLAIEAGIDVHIRNGYTEAVVHRSTGKSACCEPHDGDKVAATRLAIVRTAAELVFFVRPAGRMS